MKNIIKIIIPLVLMCSIKVKAQLDTLNYLKQFEVNKANYIGQPFSKLLNDMTQIQPKTVWNRPPINNINIVLSSQFRFCNMDYSFHNAVTLYITWETAIPRNQTDHYQKLNDFYFTNDEKNFYGNKIVKDIRVYR